MKLLQIITNSENRLKPAWIKDLPNYTVTEMTYSRDRYDALV